MCRIDRTPPAAPVKATGDQCWYNVEFPRAGAGDDLVLTMNGVSSDLVPTTVNDEWTLRDDPGWKIKRYAGSIQGYSCTANGDHRVDLFNECWLVSTPDGTRYFFGLGTEPTSGRDTGSVLNMPVFGNASGEPCFGMAASACTPVAYRWYLDRVQDTNNNVATYFYQKEQNEYGMNNSAATPVLYDRAARLVGALLASVKLGSEHIADTHVAAAAIEEQGIILTGDPDDMERLVAGTPTVTVVALTDSRIKTIPQ